jgi:hypothetical protein
VNFQPPIFAYLFPFSLVFPILFTENSLKQLFIENESFAKGVLEE